MIKAPCDLGVDPLKHPRDMSWIEKADWFNPPELVVKWNKIIKPQEQS
jgi:hypothetical protein